MRVARPVAGRLPQLRRAGSSRRRDRRSWYGPNAAGKTNLIEALVVLARGGSHRAADTELIAWGAARGTPRGGGRARWQPRPARLEVVLARSGGPEAMRGAASASASTASPRRAAALGEGLRVVLFAPEEMLLVVGPPALRRAAARRPRRGALERLRPRPGHLRTSARPAQQPAAAHPRGRGCSATSWPTGTASSSTRAAHRGRGAPGRAGRARGAARPPRMRRSHRARAAWRCAT